VTGKDETVPPYRPRPVTRRTALAAGTAGLLSAAGCSSGPSGTALAPAGRQLLTRWLVGDATGAGRIRAAVPAGWTVADKTGTGRYGTDNDIAVLWPPQRSPIVLAVLSTQATADAQPSNTLIADATRTILPAL